MAWYAEQGWDRHAAEWRTYYRLRPAKQRALRYTDPYVRVFKDGWTRLREANLNGSEAKLFFAIMERATQDETWDVSPFTLEKVLGWTRPRISTTLTMLVGAGLVQRVRPGFVTHDPIVSWSAGVQERETRKHRIRHPEFYKEDA